MNRMLSGRQDLVIVALLMVANLVWSETPIIVLSWSYMLRLHEVNVED